MYLWQDQSELDDSVHEFLCADDLAAVGVLDDDAMWEDYVSAMDDFHAARRRVIAALQRDVPLSHEEIEALVQRDAEQARLAAEEEP